MTNENGWKKSLGKFQEGLKDVFEDITALEVNTMVVTEITGLKFQPEETYEAIYDIPHLSVDKSEFTEYYSQLFFLENLEDNTNRLTSSPSESATDEPQSPVLPSEEAIKTPEQFKTECYQYYSQIPSLDIKQDLEKLKQEESEEKKESIKNQIEEKQKLIQRHLEMRQQLTQSYHYYLRKEKGKTPETANLESLPNPYIQTNKERIETLLDNRRFLAQLRKLGELKALMECPCASADNVCDIIFAQTIIQIDGDILNRFDQRLFTTLQKDKQEFLLNTHKEAVAAGEKSWRELLNSVVTLIKNIGEAIAG